MEETRLTPMIRQYLQIKEKYRDAILFFRLGDFYEMFFEDAEKASKILDIALTSRSRSEESAVPLCGVPYHAATPYIGRLLEAGYKVAICEQVEDPKTAKGVVQREVVRVITPGTITDGEALDARDNNFLAAVSQGKRNFGLAVTDVTTGEFRFTQMPDDASLMDELGRIRPSEIVLKEDDRSLKEQIERGLPGVHLSLVSPLYFFHSAQEKLKSLNLWSRETDEEWEEGIRAASVIVSYLEDNLPEVLKVLKNLQPYSSAQYLMLDENTSRNLELIRNLQGNRNGSLLEVLDYTMTAMGSRRLRQWIFYPLMDEKAIRERLDGVEELAESYSGRQDLKARLKGIQDIERLGARIASGSAGPRDLVAVKNSLRLVSGIKEKLRDFRSEILISLREKLWELPEVTALIEKAIVDDAPSVVKEGGVIRTGFHNELDEIRSIRGHAKEWIARFESSERKRTGIASLKVGYNRVFGYYIEVTRANLKSVPLDYLRKQTLANGERYITPELKEYEVKVLTSEEEILKLELSLFSEVREKVALHYDKMKEAAHALANLDVLISLAETAQAHHFVRPRIDTGLAISIREGRHPVVEESLGRGRFVPNDCYLDRESQQILVLTGPNMAGKSTYMRQVALIVILAQMGSFVPASEASIGLVDRIFTRIGAADSLARGESTFMVEMKETARILRHATPRSLILLDEVGRGTSTFDGISIAWALAEFLHDAGLRPRTLFATHYHELADLALAKERVKNFNFAVKEWKGEVIFLRNLVEGAASRSYGIHVARLAGLPLAVVERAKEILKNLDKGELDERGQPRLARGVAASEPPPQMSLFADRENRIIEELRTADVSVMTPIEALNLLHTLVEEAKKEGPDG
jgi:DNA mismatch repair protein MutS